MAIAKNLVLHHVWGVTQYGFSWISSSPLWTVLLAGAYWCIGLRIGVPLVLNAIVATATCMFAWFVFRRRGLAPSQALVALLALIFVTSIPSLTMIGMEHALQLLADCGFIYLAAETLAGPGDDWPIALIVIAPVVTTVRYEGLFLIVPAVALFVLRGRFAVASIAFAAALAPVVALGLWAMSHGWYFLPSSLMMKGNMPANLSVEAILEFGIRSVVNLVKAPWLLVVGITGGIAFYRSLKISGTIWTWPGTALAMFLAMLAADVALSRTGIAWYSRYDAYLVGCAVFIGAACWKEPSCESLTASLFTGKNPTWGRVGTFIVAVVLISHGVLTTILIPRGTNVIYGEHYQVARLLKDYYGGQSVALNDIGLAGYMTDVRITDLYGLATMDATKAHRANQFNPSTVERLCSVGDVKIAILYKEVFKDQLFRSGSPRDWIEAGNAGLLNSQQGGDPLFVFYGIGSEQANLLRAHLEEFRHSGPS